MPGLIASGTIRPSRCRRCPIWRRPGSSGGPIPPLAGSSRRISSAVRTAWSGPCDRRRASPRVGRSMAVVIHGAQLIDGTGAPAVADGAVVVEDDRITAVGPISSLRLPPGAQVVEAGGTVLPGFVNAHTHCSIIPGLGDQTGQMRAGPLPSAFRAAGNMRRELRSGVTTARIMGEEHYLDVELRRAIEAGFVPGPRLLCSGVHLTSSHGHGRALTTTDGVDAV